MDDVRFNAMALAGHNRALERRRAEMEAAGNGDFAQAIATDIPAPSLVPSGTLRAETEAAEPPTATETALPPPAAAASADPAEALKASPAAANLSGDQMALLLSSFGQASANPKEATAPMARRSDSADPLAASSADTMSATNFFPIHRREGAAPALASSDEPAAENAEDRFFPIRRGEKAAASLVSTIDHPAEPAMPGATPAGTAPVPTAEASVVDDQARFFPTHRTRDEATSALSARDAYLRTLDMTARALGTLNPS